MEFQCAEDEDIIQDVIEDFQMADSVEVDDEEENDEESDNYSPRR